MCYAASCNPLCGKCRPRRIVEVTCPDCGMAHNMTREEYLVLSGLPHKANILEKKLVERGVASPRCAVCGADLMDAFQAEVRPLPCMRSRIVCGFPCGRNGEPYVEGAMPCPHMVPVGKLPA